MSTRSPVTVAYAGLELRREIGTGKEIKELSAQGKWLKPESGSDNPGRALLGQRGSRTEPQGPFPS